MRHIPAGGSWRDIPIDLLPAGMKLAKRSDHTKRYGRPKKTDLSCTVLTKCDVHWGAYIHPVQDRSFTVRRSEEHTSELQSLMRISYAVFCLKKKTQQTTTTNFLENDQ